MSRGTRIRKGPPRKLWPKKAETEKVKNARLYQAVRELKRIEVAGGKLLPAAKSWLDARIGRFPELADLTIEQDFPGNRVFQPINSASDDRFDTLEGAPRLQLLETALSGGHEGWGDNPAERANEWKSRPEKAVLILGDLTHVENGGDAFPRVWNRFGWAHSPIQTDTGGTFARNSHAETDTVLALLLQLSESTLTDAIEGVSNWLDVWRKQVVAAASGLSVWMKVWPIAVKATNSRNQTPQHIAGVLTRERAAVRLPERFNDNPKLAELVNVATPARPGMLYRGAARLIARFQLEQCPCVASANGNHRSVVNLGFHCQEATHRRRSPSRKPAFAMMVSAVASVTRHRRATHRVV